MQDRAGQPIVAHFSDGTSAEGDFLIGADGVHSAVRGHVIPNGPVPFDTGLISFGGFVPRAILEAAGAPAKLALAVVQRGFVASGVVPPARADSARVPRPQPIPGVDAATLLPMCQGAAPRRLD